MKLSEVFNNFIAEQKRAQNLTTKKLSTVSQHNFVWQDTTKKRLVMTSFKNCTVSLSDIKTPVGWTSFPSFSKIGHFGRSKQFFGMQAFKCLKIIRYKLVWFWFKCDYKTYNISLASWFWRRPKPFVQFIVQYWHHHYDTHKLAWLLRNKIIIVLP